MFSLKKFISAGAFLLGALSISQESFADIASCPSEKKYEDSLLGFKLTSEVKHQMFESGLEPSTEEKHFLSQEGLQVPTHFADIFYQGVDYPAAIIQQRAQESFEYWSSINHEDEDLSQHQISTAVFRELNLESQGLWQNLLICNHEDPEVSRKQFFKGTFCDDKKQAEQIRSALQVLGQNVWSFLVSGPLMASSRDRLSLEVEFQRQDSLRHEYCRQYLKDLYPARIGETELARCENRESGSHFISSSLSIEGDGPFIRPEFGRFLPQIPPLPTDIKISHVHPLLSQLLIQSYNASFIAPFEKDTSLALINEHSGLVNEVIATGGDLPAFIKYYKVHFLTDLSFLGLKMKTTDQWMLFYNATKEVINSHILIQALINGAADSQSPCSAMGLWPAANRMVFDMRGDDRNMRLLESGVLTDFEDKIWISSHRICRFDDVRFGDLGQRRADPSQTVSRKISKYSIYAYRFHSELKRLQALSNTQFGAENDIRELVIEHEEAQTPMEKLLCR